jgi:hypothetical protein
MRQRSIKEVSHGLLLFNSVFLTPPLQAIQPFDFQRVAHIQARPQFFLKNRLTLFTFVDTVLQT